MLTNGLGEQLVSENTSESINRNTRPQSFYNPTDIGDRSRIIVDTVLGNWVKRTNAPGVYQDLIIIEKI